MKVDYLIVGQGICGTFLSHALLQSGRSVLVIDESKPFTSSKVASGVINPITGRRMVRTWEIEKIMPFAVAQYREMEQLLNASFIRQCNILDFHPTPQMVLAFRERQPEEKDFLRYTDDPAHWQQYFNFDFTIGEIDPCWLIDLNALLGKWRQYLRDQQCLLEQRFELSGAAVSEDKILYEEIEAGKIFFCDGVEGFLNPYFKQLPYARNKGEAIIAEIKDLPRQHIFKQGISLVPWKEDHLWWIGSTYEWDFTDTKPTDAFRNKVKQQLDHWLKLPYQVVDHFAGERPANMERRPFAGLHPVMPSVGILNGMGTKGCSLAPYFAHELAAYLVQGTPITAQADVQRFRRVLSR